MSGSPRDQVVVLVHGIRDYALWQNAVRAQLEEAGFIVEATNYGRFSLWQFLIPFWPFRRYAIRRVLNQIRIVRQQYEGKKISIIAHSFGTYIIANIMQAEFDIEFHRVIFCGSVVPYSFPFEQFKQRFEDKILNEVGTGDVWPAMAQSVTWGYGSAGTFGFRRPLVRDRWHNGARHGYFLEGRFCSEFWVPFLTDRTLVRGAQEPAAPSLFVQLISTFRLKYLVPIVAAVTAWAIASWPDPVLEPPRPEPLPSSVSVPPSGAEVSWIINPPAFDEPARTWMEVALAEVGVAETIGVAGNPRIVEYLASTTFPNPTQDVPWSGAFINWVVEQAGLPGTNSAVNSDWRNWGVEVSLRPGCIAFFEPQPGASGRDSVGFYLGTAEGGLEVLGGNIRNSVTTTVLPLDRFVTCRWWPE